MSSVDKGDSVLEKPRLYLFNPKLIPQGAPMEQHTPGFFSLQWDPLNPSSPCLFSQDQARMPTAPSKPPFRAGSVPARRGSAAGDKGAAPAGAAFPRGAGCLPG